MEPATLQEYLFLCHFSALSDLDLARLLCAFGTLDSISNATADELEAIDFDERVQGHLFNAQQHASMHPEVAKALEWGQQQNHSIICYEDPRYPRLLKEIDHAPPLLYVRGNYEALSSHQLAIVGSRKASPYGLNNAYQLARDAAEANLTVTSGMANGIDSAAHQGALGQSAMTIAVVGTGIDQCYPKGNFALMERIENSGAVVSEFPLGSPPLAHHFPRRNRIITGLSLGVLVVEAAQRSGSLISARTAMEQNREVFSIPGMVSNPLAAGCHRLIKDGVRLVENINDVLEELSPAILDSLSSKHPENENHINGASHAHGGLVEQTTNHRQIIRVLRSQPCLLDTLIAETEMAEDTLIQSLFELEMYGVISLESGRYNYRQP